MAWHQRFQDPQKRLTDAICSRPMGALESLGDSLGRLALRQSMREAKTRRLEDVFLDLQDVQPRDPLPRSHCAVSPSSPNPLPDLCQSVDSAETGYQFAGDALHQPDHENRDSLGTWLQGSLHDLTIGATSVTVSLYEKFKQPQKRITDAICTRPVFALQSFGRLAFSQDMSAATVAPFEDVLLNSQDVSPRCPAGRHCRAQVPEPPNPLPDLCKTTDSQALVHQTMVPSLPRVLCMSMGTKMSPMCGLWTQRILKQPIQTPKGNLTRLHGKCFPSQCPRTKP